MYFGTFHETEDFKSGIDRNFAAFFETQSDSALALIEKIKIQIKKFNRLTVTIFGRNLKNSDLPLDQF
jgi:hypothetical protein